MKDVQDKLFMEDCPSYHKSRSWVIEISSCSWSCRGRSSSKLCDRQALDMFLDRVVPLKIVKAAIPWQFGSVKVMIPLISDGTGVWLIPYAVVWVIRAQNRRIIVERLFILRGFFWRDQESSRVVQERCLPSYILPYPKIMKTENTLAGPLSQQLLLAQ